MGYYASGSGYINLKKEADLDAVKKALDKAREEIDGDISGSWSDGYKIYAIDLYISDDHWHEEDLYDLFNAVMPYIVEAVVDMKGEDDCYWRYLYNPETQKIDEIQGTIVYGNDLSEFSLEDLTAEINRRKLADFDVEFTSTVHVQAENKDSAVTLAEKEMEKQGVNMENSPFYIYVNGESYS